LVFWGGKYYSTPPPKVLGKMVGTFLYLFRFLIASRFDSGHGECPKQFRHIKAAFGLLISLSIIGTAFGQGTPFVNCTETAATFSGVAAPTLCEQYGGLSCSIQIGAGSPFPKSSLLGSTSLSGNVCVIGNFEVDVPLTFLNAVVKINPGVTIAIKPSPNGYDSGSSLSIDNSKLFACSGLWKGITVGQLSTVSTSNNTSIEDAEVAILATGLSSLTIQQTTFNRNRVGVELFTALPNPFVPGPLVWAFTGNNFTCDAPLNGTINEITHIGVKIKDSYLYATQSITNRFFNLNYGIVSEGVTSVLELNNATMEGIRNDGIFMEHGALNLINCTFTNCIRNGVRIGTAHRVDLRQCRFNFTTSFVASDLLPRNGVSINAFAAGSYTRINVGVNANMLTVDNLIRGVYLKGGNVGAGSQITILDGRFFLRTKNSSYGITLDGFFPSSSQTNIYNNDFELTSSISTAYGINSMGTKNDFHIYGNRFSPNLSGGVFRAIELIGSDGINNEVSDNRFFPSPNLSDAGFLSVANFDNLKICSNILSSTGTTSGFYFFDTNAGTDFTGNKIYAMGNNLILLNSLIGPQSHKGNEWHPYTHKAHAQAIQVKPVIIRIGGIHMHDGLSGVFSIADAAGRILLSKTMPAGTAMNKIDLDLSPGIYFTAFKSESGKLLQGKLVVQK
jgi:hypothetical protein